MQQPATVRTLTASVFPARRAGYRASQCHDAGRSLPSSDKYAAPTVSPC